MKLQPLDESLHDEWDRFVSKAKGSIFHTAWWYKAWNVKFKIYAYRNKGGEIEAGIPVYISGFKKMPKIFCIKGLTKAPLTVANGPLYFESAKSGRCGAYSHAKEEVLSAINSLPIVDFYDILLHRFQDDLMPYIWNGFDTHVYYTYIIPSGDSENWRANMAPGARRNLKLAHKESEARGCTLEIDGNIDDFISLFVETSVSNGVPQKRLPRLIPGWWKAVKEKQSGRSYILRDGTGEALCAALAVWDTHTMYYMLGGMSGRVRDSYFNMLVFERMIMDSFEMGLDFDFEGSVLKGVEGFFRKWGGKLCPCYRVTKSPSLLAYAGFKIYRYLKFHRHRDWVE